MSDWRETYYDRVRPVVGQALATKHLAVWRPERCYVAAEALARSGLRRQTWLSSATAAGALCRSLGRQLAGEPAGAALAAHCRAHNRFETDWALQHVAAEHQALEAALHAPQRPDLLLAALDERAGEVCRAAIEAAVPFVMVHVPAGGALGAAALVWTPRSAVDAGALVRLSERLGALPRRDLDARQSHLDGLEAASLALALCRFLLAPDRPPRPDLASRLVEQGRAVVLRGQPAWPWTVRFVRPDDPGLVELAADARPAYQPPPVLWGDERVMVLGLGTASLFVGEAPLLGRRLLLVDGGAVSPYNPVRQLYGTDEIGLPKGEAAVRILRRRLDPSNALGWSTSVDGALTVHSAGDWALAHAALLLRARDRASVRRFGELLDRFAPTLVVVGMGRSRDDNFTATAELRRRGIRHLTPTAFPGVSHYKQILTDGGHGPCYDCLQGHLAIDGGAGPSLSPDEQQMFYGGTQPATLAETLPSAHSLLRLARDLALPPAARPPYLQAQLAAERNCLVGANRVERDAGGGWLYGVDRPFKMVSFGIADIVGSRAEQPCPCGRINRVRDPRPDG